jgi:subtilisin family serine protease
VTVTKAGDYLSSLPGVEYVEEQREIKTESGYFNDPYYSSQWHYCSPGTSTFLAGADIDVEPVWRNYTTGNSDVTVAVVDGGIDLTHEDLADNVIAAGTDGSKNFVDENYVIVPHNHGTHVGGTISAINNNGIGVCGIAGGNYATGTKGVRLLSCQIFKTNPADPSKDLSGDGAEAIKWGCDHGAVIANNSWGYSYETYAEAEAGVTPQYLKDAIDYFIKYAGYNASGVQVGPMAGGVVIFAAGNDGWDIAHPADYENVIAVGSITSKLGRSSFSNYGDWVDICAPGGDAYGSATDITSTYPSNKYGLMAGTSMACPHVTGVAALIVSYFGGKGFTNEQLKEKLFGGANSTIIPSSLRIGPLVDAMGSFTYNSLAAPDPITDYETSVNSNTAELTFKVTSSSDGQKAYGYLLVASKDRNVVQDYSPTSTSEEGAVVANVLTESKNAGDEITGSVPGLDFSSDYYVGIFAYNYHKKYSVLSPIKTLTTGINHPPLVTAVTEPPYKLKASEVKTYAFKISDPDGHKFTTSFSGGSSAATSESSTDGSVCTVTIRGRKAVAGTYTAKFTVTDAYDASTAYAFDYTIAENQPPTVIKTIDNMILYELDKTFSFDMTQYMSDPDDSTLTYKYRGDDEGVLSISIKDNIVTCKTESYGLTTLTLVGVDGAAKECLVSFDVLVNGTLYVRTEEAADTHIRISNSSGAVVYDKTASVSGFNPAAIDMSKCSPGAYGLTVSYSGKTFKRSIVKK